MLFPKVILLPQLVAEGLGSTSFTYAENTLALKSVDPAASKMLLGCQSMLKKRTDLYDFLTYIG